MAKRRSPTSTTYCHHDWSSETSPTSSSGISAIDRSRMDRVTHTRFDVTTYSQRCTRRERERDAAEDAAEDEEAGEADDAAGDDIPIAETSIETPTRMSIPTARPTSRRFFDGGPENDRFPGVERQPARGRGRPAVSHGLSFVH